MKSFTVFWQMLRIISCLVQYYWRGEWKHTCAGGIIANLFCIKSSLSDVCPKCCRHKSIQNFLLFSRTPLCDVAYAANHFPCGFLLGFHQHQENLKKFRVNPPRRRKTPVIKILGIHPERQNDTVFEIYEKEWIKTIWCSPPKKHCWTNFISLKF